MKKQRRIKQTHLRLLVPLGHNVLEGGSHHGTLELLCSPGPLLGHILLETLLVLPGRENGYLNHLMMSELPPVENGPGNVPGVPLQHMSLVGDKVKLALLSNDNCH